MTLTFDSTRLVAKLAAAREMAQPEITALLPGTALATLLGSGYLDPEEGETGFIDPEEVITEPESMAMLTYVGILQVYDWVLDEEANHCSSAGGLDCPTIAAGGPYLATFAVRPGDGTTPCGQKCRCAFLPRPLDLADAAKVPVEELAQAFRLQIARVWKEGR